MKPVTGSHMKSTTCRIWIHLAPNEMYSMKTILHAEAFAKAFRIQHGTTLQSVVSGVYLKYTMFPRKSSLWRFDDMNMVNYRLFLIAFGNKKLGGLVSTSRKWQVVLLAQVFQISQSEVKDRVYSFISEAHLPYEIPFVNTFTINFCRFWLWQ